MASQTPNPHSSSPQIIATQWNIRGLRKNLPELQLLLNKFSPLVFALQETQVSLDKIPTIHSDYSWQFLEGQTRRSCHGVGIGIRKSVPSCNINLSTSLQAIAVKVGGPLPATFVSIYLPPSLSDCKEISKHLNDLLSQLPPPIVLLGDLNGHNFEWGSPSCDNRGQMLLDFTIQNKLSILNSGEPTRVDALNGNFSHLDLCIVSRSLSQKLVWTVHNDTGGSDHFPTFISTHSKSQPLTSRPKWKYEEADWEKYRLEVSAVTTFSSQMSLDDFRDAIVASAKVSIPQTSGKPGRKSVPWWNPTVAVAIKQRRKALRRLRRLSSNDPRKTSYASTYRLANQAAKLAVQKAKNDSWEQFTSEINPRLSSKEMWRRVGALSGKKKRTDQVIIHNDLYISDPTEVAEAFAEHFFEISANTGYTPRFQNYKAETELSEVIFPDCPDDAYNDPFAFNELLWALHKSNGRSAGPDSIGYPLLRNLPLSAQLTLLDLFNGIWLSGKIPDQWKSSLVIPIAKQTNNPLSANSFRPISLVDCMSKVLERMVNRRLVGELESRGLLSQSQHAFRSGRGTESYFAELERVISDPLSKGKHVDCAIIDISKAYDRTWRRLILETLARWGFGGRMAKFVANFLTNRSFQVLVGGCTSSPHIQENGIPQGAVLSVTLFLISMETLFASIPNSIKIIVYADDILLISRDKCFKKARKKLHEGIVKVRQWAKFSGYQISSEKSKILHICRKRHRPPPDVTIQGETIPTVSSAKILGVTIDKTFKFGPHIEITKKSVKTRLNLLKMLGTGRHRASRESLRTILCNWFVPKLLYGIELFSHAGEQVISKLAASYNQAVRNISGAFCTSPTLSLLCEFGVPPFNILALQHIVSAAIRLEEKSHFLTVSPILDRVREDFYKVVGSPLPEIAKRPRLCNRYWWTPTPRVDWSMKSNVKAGGNPAISRQHFHELIQGKYSNHNIIYTDGSVCAGETACGVVYNGNSASIRLPQFLSIFSAEATAIVIAIDECLSHTQPNVIFTDSASVLSAVEKGCSLHPLIQILDSIPPDNNVTLCWVPAHCGIAGNELADIAANKGRSVNPEPKTPVPGSDARRWVKQALANNWGTTWGRNRDTFLRKIKNTTQPWRDLPCPSDQRALTRLRIGHTRVTHEYILNRTDKPSCTFCGVALSTEHLLMECRGYTNERVACQLDNSIFSVLSNDPTAEKKLLKFLRETQLIELI